MAASVRMRNTTLFSSNDDVLCHRVRLVLAAKGVTFDFVPVDPQNPPEDLIDLNPYHSVPTLVERELVLYAASVVSEYLDERYPHPPLMPVDPLSRARIRLAMLRIEHDWVPQVQAIQLGNKTQAEAGRKRLKELLTASLPLFKASKFFLNPEMSLADCAMAPIIWRLRSLDVPLPKDGKAIEDYGNRIFRHPGFVRSLTEQEKNCAICRSDPSPRYPSAGRPACRRSTGGRRAYTSRMTEDFFHMTSHRPYLLRALVEWINDNQLTPHIRSTPASPACRSRLRRSRIRVVLNIAERAVVRLMIDNEMVSFSARFPEPATRCRCRSAPCWRSTPARPGRAWHCRMTFRATKPHRPAMSCCTRKARRRTTRRRPVRHRRAARTCAWSSNHSDAARWAAFSCPFGGGCRPMAGTSSNPRHPRHPRHPAGSG